MKKLISLVPGMALLFSSLATDLYAGNKFNLPNFEKMKPQIETYFRNNDNPIKQVSDDYDKGDSVIYRVYLKPEKEDYGYVTFSIKCFGREKVMFCQDLFRKRAFSRKNFFSDFKNIPSSKKPDYSRMKCPI